MLIILFIIIRLYRIIIIDLVINNLIRDGLYLVHLEILIPYLMLEIKLWINSKLSFYNKWNKIKKYSKQII